eukprot:2625832-Rhodomonas_salina.2
MQQTTLDVTVGDITMSAVQMTVSLLQVSFLMPDDERLSDYEHDPTMSNPKALDSQPSRVRVLPRQIPVRITYSAACFITLWTMALK